ncbi:UbiX family flavin prenyltransferase [Diaphorobacter sp. HDW4A]|uniref:UbiX family flavin prenyltransferase n=1 Tax=Diaphorobacter sp. HDW4A TaxID=2714924 RepID=UPI00140CB717|nr:UbiX family flavin prenyltransferase [Diaphorobacter sp. HDW4A]QIL78729.1 UbiX family flavin prenyltransferase [Diaphorobacter sp. HDW4A]
MPQRIVIGISGASGAVYGVRLLQALADIPNVQAHLVVSNAGWRTLRHELDLTPAYVQSLADVMHDNDNIGASIASGSFAAHGMVIAPCSMRSLAAIAHGLADNLLTRTADVMLKERRRLILMARETPLHLVHLRNMTMVTEMGGIICPPVPAFYQHPQSIDDIVRHSVARVLDLLGLEHALATAWPGLALCDADTPAP